MDRIVFAIIGIAASIAAYFWGVQNGQTAMNQLSIQQEAMRHAEVISMQMQYMTLLDLQKSAEMKLLIKSRLLSEKTQLEQKLASGQVAESAILKDAIFNAQTALTPQ